MHQLKLDSEPFEAIITGRKTIESRLNDDKRQTIRIGDKLEFINRETNESITTKVIALHHYPSFREMFENLEPTKFGGPDSDWLVEQIRQFYSERSESLHGVVGIEFTLENNLTR